MIHIKNDILGIEFDHNYPIVKSYTHLKTGERFPGADRQGTLIINGEAVEWEWFKISVKQSKNAVTYKLIFMGLSICFDIHFALNDQSLMIELCNIDDINDDGVSDISDYRLWLNRHIPDGDSIYHKAIVYKIFMDLPSCGLKTTISQAQEIIKAMLISSYNIFCNQAKNCWLSNVPIYAFL